MWMGPRCTAEAAGQPARGASQGEGSRQRLLGNGLWILVAVLTQMNSRWTEVTDVRGEAVWPSRKQGSEFGLLSGEVSGQKLHKKNQDLCLD